MSIYFPQFIKTFSYLLENLFILHGQELNILVVYLIEQKKVICVGKMLNATCYNPIFT